MVFDSSHLKRCKKAKSQFGACIWLKNKKAWQNEFQVHDADGNSVGTWLIDNGKGVGCACCAQFWELSSKDAVRTPKKSMRYAKLRLGKPHNTIRNVKKSG